MTSLRDELQSIYDSRGLLTPGILLEEASKPKHPLHTRFEWDDSIAAQRYRLEQAHELIVSVKITFAGKRGREKSVRRYHAVRTADEQQFVYEPIEELQKDEFKRHLVLQDMEREWKTLKARYGDFVEFWQMIAGDEAKAS